MFQWQLQKCTGARLAPGQWKVEPMDSTQLTKFVKHHDRVKSNEQCSKSSNVWMTQVMTIVLTDFGRVDRVQEGTLPHRHKAPGHLGLDLQAPHILVVPENNKVGIKILLFECDNLNVLTLF